MDITRIVRKAVSIATKQTASVQGTVLWRKRTGQSVTGTQRYAAPVALQAIISEGQKEIRGADGRPVTTTAMLNFLTLPTGVAILARDEITLPSGLVGTVAQSQATPTDPGTRRAFASTIWLV